MRGLVVGRFQPLHNGHVRVLRDALKECGSLAIAIGSSTAPATLRNPFSCDERKAMLEAVLGPDMRAGAVSLHAVPDLHDATRWARHCLELTGPVDCVYGNDEATLELFEREGIPVRRPGLWERSQLEATAIRRLLAEDDAAWRQAVPPAVARLLDEWGATARLLRLGA